MLFLCMREKKTQRGCNCISWLIPCHCIISVELTGDSEYIKTVLVALKPLSSRWGFNLFSLTPSCICMQCVCLNSAA